VLRCITNVTGINSHTSRPHEWLTNTVHTMGWLKATALLPHRAGHEQTTNNHSLDEKKDLLVKHDSTSVQHLEQIDIPGVGCQHLTYPIQSIELEDGQLPFIADAVVRSAKHDLGRTWIVVDNIVYDCTEFALQHPGGETVIESFAGQDCSWQFWRFHNKTHMRQSGRPLRVGWTSGVKNRFAERPRFVGLRRKDEW
jgi:cytochrome b involved in lipid metabolism